MANMAWKSFKGIPLVVTLVWIVAFAAALHFMDKSVIAFLGILSSIVLVYYTNASKTVRMIIGAAVLLIIIPLVAGENRYYMEVASQVGIYVAMALGLSSRQQQFTIKKASESFRSRRCRFLRRHDWFVISTYKLHQRKNKSD